MRLIDANEMNQISAGSIGEYIGAVVGAICGFYSKTPSGAGACAAVGVATTQAANAVGNMNVSDFGQRMDNMNGGNMK